MTTTKSCLNETDMRLEDIKKVIQALIIMSIKKAMIAYLTDWTRNANTHQSQ